MTTTAAGFLQNLISSGVRPLARPKLPGRSSALLRERTEERPASAPETMPPAATIDRPALESPAPLPAAAAPGAEPTVASKPPEPARPAEPQATEIDTTERHATKVMPSLFPAIPQPAVARDQPSHAARAPDHTPAEPMVPVGPAEHRPATEHDTVVERRTAPRAVERAVEAQPPKVTHREPERRMPAAVGVEGTPPKAVQAAASRMVPMREARAPERPLPAPRVEFAIAGEPVSVLPKPAAVPARPAVQDSAPPPRDSDRGLAATSVPPPASAAPAREPPAPAPSRAAPTSTPLVPQDLKAPRPALMSAAPMPVARREADNTISIRQLDIQIMAEEPRSSQGRNRRESAPTTREPVPLGRYYLREMP